MNSFTYYCYIDHLKIFWIYTVCIHTYNYRHPKASLDLKVDFQYLCETTLLNRFYFQLLEIHIPKEKISLRIEALFCRFTCGFHYVNALRLVWIACLCRKATANTLQFICWHIKLITGNRSKTYRFVGPITTVNSIREFVSGGYGYEGNGGII